MTMARTGLMTNVSPGAKAPGVVWVVHPVHGVDISPASEWGTVRYINSRYVYPDELDNSNNIPRDFHDRLEEAACAFKEGDSLVMIGDHVQVVTLVYKLASKGKSFPMLRYDRQVERYVPVRIDK